MNDLVNSEADGGYIVGYSEGKIVVNINADGRVGTCKVNAGV